MGHNALAMTVKTLCQSAGVHGYFTNHSLHRTCATRLYNKGADEQEIMSITGHRSSNAVRLYKTVSLEQEQKLSNMLKSGSATSIDKENKDCNSLTDDTTKPTFLFNFCTVTINNIVCTMSECTLSSF